VIGIGVSGSRTGAAGSGSVSGGKGIGPGFGFSGSAGSCGVTGGMSGLSVESANRLFVKLCKDVPPCSCKRLFRPNDIDVLNECAVEADWTLLRSRVQQALDDLDSRHDARLGHLKASGEYFGSL